MKPILIILTIIPLTSFGLSCERAEKMGEFLNMNGKTFMDSYKKHKQNGNKTELIYNVDDINQAKRMAYKFPALQDLGFPPIDKSWSPFVVKMESSSLKGMKTGYQFKNVNGDIAIVRLDYDPVKGAHYNIDVTKKTPKGKESYKLAIEFNCNGKPCSADQVVNLAKNMNQ